MYTIIYSKVGRFIYNLVGTVLLWSIVVHLMIKGLDGADGIGIGLIMLYSGPILLIITPLIFCLFQDMLFTAITERHNSQYRAILGASVIVSFSFVFLRPIGWNVSEVVVLITLFWSVLPVWAQYKLKAETAKKKH